MPRHQTDLELIKEIFRDLDRCRATGKIEGLEVDDIFDDTPALIASARRALDATSAEEGA